MADLFITWAELDGLVDQLAARLVGKRFDYYLGIIRGGLTLTHLLAERLDQRDVLAAAVKYYEGKSRLEQPLLLFCPPEIMFHGKHILIVDEVWQSGQTLTLIKKIIERAGGTC